MSRGALPSASHDDGGGFHARCASSSRRERIRDDQAAEPSDWEAVRDIRLRSLREEPDAYASDYQTEARFEPAVWRQRLATASSYLAFDDDHALVGIATGLDTGDGDTYVVGMYVTPEARGSGCAHRLLDAIADLAAPRQESASCSRWPSPISAPRVPTARTDSWRPVGDAPWIVTQALPRSSLPIRSSGGTPRIPDACRVRSIRSWTGHFRGQAQDAHLT